MKCGKVKNPCKICFQSVSNRNGLQCKGACKKWAHFKCLNYTPGKISDIKAGLIKVTCPCPDCITEPKEVLTNPPFTCTNEGCPATKRPSCEVPDCPSKQKPIPSFPPQISTPPRSASPKAERPPPAAPKCPTPPRKSSCPASPKRGSPPRVASPPRRSSCPPSPKNVSPQRSPVASRPASSPTATAPGPPCPSCPVHCPKRSSPNLAKEIPSPQRSRSCSLNSPASFHSGKSRMGIPRSCSSDSALLSAQDQKMIYSAIEHMCDTVGQLSSQLKDLMCKMMNAFQKNKRNAN